MPGSEHGAPDWAPTIADLLKDQGSAMLRGVVEADCLAALGPTARHEAGDLIEVVPLGLLV